jgi:hypothetical protein
MEFFIRARPPPSPGYGQKTFFHHINPKPLKMLRIIQFSANLKKNFFLTNFFIFLGTLKAHLDESQDLLVIFGGK